MTFSPHRLAAAFLVIVALLFVPARALMPGSGACAGKGGEEWAGVKRDATPLRLSARQQ
jgi:hypothetical protein